MNEVTYILSNNEQGQKITIDEKSIRNLDKDSIKKLEDLGTVLINTVLAGTEEGINKLLEYSDISKVAQKAHELKLKAITLPTDYLIYLSDQREKYGEVGWKEYATALGQTAAGWAAASSGAKIGMAIGTAAGKFIPIPIAGPIIGGIGGAIVFSVAYDIKNFYGKSTSAWIGEAARNVYEKFASDFGSGEKNKKSFDSLSQVEKQTFITDFLRAQSGIGSCEAVGGEFGKWGEALSPYSNFDFSHKKKLEEFKKYQESDNEYKDSENKKAEEYGPPYVKAGNSNPNSEPVTQKIEIVREVVIIEVKKSERCQKDTPVTLAMKVGN